MKRRVHLNVWGNWNGYEGNRKVKEFGCNAVRADGQFHDEIQEWLDGKDKPVQEFVLCEPGSGLVEALKRLR